MEQIYDVIIIGSGPAGLAAAIYAERAKLKTITLEKNMMSGGQVLNTYEVDNYPGLQGINGFDMGMKFREHAEALGAKFVEDEVLDMDFTSAVKKVSGKKGTYETKTVLISTGAHYRKLGVSGEAEYSGLGVSYCATCDGAFFRDKVVAVVGGGNVALEDAIFLARSCKKVYLIHRRDALRGVKALQEKVLATENIEVLWSHTVEDIFGEDIVAGITVKDLKKNEEREVALDGVFIAVGILPNSEMFKGKVDMDDYGYIIAGEDTRTSVPGVFVAGDIRTKSLRQIVTAVSDGANAVTSIERYLTENTIM